MGLPKFAFGPLLEEQYSDFLDKVSTTDGFYWINASWGISTSPG